ncbi:hypothetical protein P7K49_005514 [Saguinus oedipus]|uniref:Uncharacterized protein n=1 Tax=Saguinus oedipus TaxID=9490 RepID=A0ABQ9VZV8_SAGOE|nr:hypothetical protein P7K49_005514 [Saguinus oedipus]
MYGRKAFCVSDKKCIRLKDVVGIVLGSTESQHYDLSWAVTPDTGHSTAISHGTLNPSAQ